MRLVIGVRGYEPAPSGWYRRAYVDFDRDVTNYAVIGFHWLFRAYDRWRVWRWSAERIGIRIGLYDLAEGGFYRDGRWTLAFWRVWQARVASARSCGYRDADRAYKEGLRDGEEQFIEHIRTQLAIERAVFEKGQPATAGAPAQ